MSQLANHAGEERGVRYDRPPNQKNTGGQTNGVGAIGLLFSSFPPVGLLAGKSPGVWFPE